jgi:hypothetical protein
MQTMPVLFVSASIRGLLPTPAAVLDVLACRECRFQNYLGSSAHFVKVVDEDATALADCFQAL